MIDLNRVLVISNLHRASRFFDSSLRRLQAAGLTHIVLQDTGAGLGTSTVAVEKHLHIPYALSYDAGMTHFRKNLDVSGYDTVLLIDSDSFLSGTDELLDYITEFQACHYDLACHRVQTHGLPELDYGDGQIAHIPKLGFEESTHGMPPAPIPHFENTGMLFSQRLWSQITPEEFGHSRIMLAAADRLGGKIGARHAHYRGIYTHFGREWFHVGNLVAYFYMIEGNWPDKLNPDSLVDLCRIGYFLAEQACYGPEIYSDTFRQNLARVVERMGGSARCLAHWQELTLDTCMEHWVA